MSQATRSRVVAQARALLVEAEALVGGQGAPSSDREASAGRSAESVAVAGVLDLYERLTSRLAALDDEKVSGLLGSIRKQLADLDCLIADMDRLKRVKGNLRRL